MKQNQKSLDDKEAYFKQWGIDGINAFIKVLEYDSKHGFGLNWSNTNKYIKMFRNVKEALETNNKELLNTVYPPEFLWLDCYLSYLRDLSVTSYKIETKKED